MTASAQRKSNPRVRTTRRKLQALGDASKPRPKMGYEIARQIRALHQDGYGRTEISRKFGINPRTVYDVVNFVTWKEEKNG